MRPHIICPYCSARIQTETSICPSCGLTIEDAATQRLDSQSPQSSKPTSFDSIDNARFVSGAILADRYRIVGLLGKGGMGEVYRADDLKLGQAVALKFLPEHLLTDGATLARFHREVRVARQVSHRNVCRVYDIGEANGRHFLSMEYIKGEELSSLLRRIGRLPSDKAIQLARQICAGLNAAHDAGVLHRDLKPANVMIDGDGNARITDFGLAGLAEEFGEEELAAGTPAYMAPEQLEGRPFTARSDLYSLGLLLYELFTSRRAFEAATLGELLALRRSNTAPTTPTAIVKDLDPVIERVIDRCIQTDPAERPASALQVAAALPGGDPIAAALAAGETPSPEMVAAAPRAGALRPAQAVAMLAAIVVGLALIVLLADKVVLHGYVPLDKSPDVLQETARDIVRKAGVVAPATDHMYAFEQEREAIRYIARSDPRPERWQDLKDGQPAVVVYWYRQSPAYLGGFDFFRDAWTNPPATVSGMAGVKLDTRGRLLEFYTVPPQIDPQPQVLSSETQIPSPQSSSSNPNHSAASTSENQRLETQNLKPATDLFSPLFAAAGLDPANLKPTPSQWAPLYAHDIRAAWEGVYPEQPQIPIRVEAAAYQNNPVYFKIVNPWDKPERQEPAGLSRQTKAAGTLMLSLFVLAVVGSVLLAVRNMRLGRGDHKGALRLAIFVFTFTELSRIFTAHHVPTFQEIGTLLNGLKDALFAAAFFWVVYLAIEPFVRRRSPHRIISWSRLLAGDFRDPLVGRDILIGGVFGVAITLWQLSFFTFRRWLGDSTLQPSAEPAASQLGMGYFVQAMLSQLTTPLLNVFLLLFLILLLSLILRRDWLGFVIGWLVFTTGLALIWGGAPVVWLSAGVTAGLGIFALYRFGLVAAMFTLFYLHLYIHFPVTSNLTAWYAKGFVIDLIILLLLALYAFRVSLAGQPLTRGTFLQDV